MWTDPRAFAASQSKPPGPARKVMRGGVTVVVQPEHRRTNVGVRRGGRTLGVVHRQSETGMRRLPRRQRLKPAIEIRAIDRLWLNANSFHGLWNFTSRNNCGSAMSATLIRQRKLKIISYNNRPRSNICKRFCRIVPQ